MSLEISLATVIAGALGQEIVHHVQLRNTLPHEKYLALLGAAKYWVLSLLFISISPILAPFWFGEELIKDPERQDLLIFGAGVPSVLRSCATASLAGMNRLTLGPRPEISFRSYFGI